MTRRRMLPVDARRYARSVARTERLHRRRERGMFRAAIARARQLAERVCRPLGLRFDVRRDRGLIVIKVERPTTKIDAIAWSGWRCGLRWIGWRCQAEAGTWAYLPTRTHIHAEARGRCRAASEAHAPGCGCDECDDVPF